MDETKCMIFVPTQNRHILLYDVGNYSYGLSITLKYPAVNQNYKYLENHDYFLSSYKANNTIGR